MVAPIDADRNAARLASRRAAETIGRPFGPERFLDKITALTGRDARLARRASKKWRFGKASR